METTFKVLKGSYASFENELNELKKSWNPMVVGSIVSSTDYDIVALVECYPRTPKVKVSDEQIDKEAEENRMYPSIKTYSLSVMQDAFIDGARWMRNKINE